jgi:hypothetical protein
MEMNNNLPSCRKKNQNANWHRWNCGASFGFALNAFVVLEVVIIGSE